MVERYYVVVFEDARTATGRAHDVDVLDAIHRVANDQRLTLDGVYPAVFAGYQGECGFVKVSV